MENAARLFLSIDSKASGTRAYWYLKRELEAGNSEILQQAKRYYACGTIAHIAVEHDDTNLFKLLKENDCFPGGNGTSSTMTNEYGGQIEETHLSLFQAACSRKNLELAKMIYECSGATEERLRTTPIICALRERAHEIVKYLLTKGETFKKDSDGKSPALYVNSLELLHLLKEHNFDLAAEGTVLLRNASCVESVDFLLENGAQLDGDLSRLLCIHVVMERPDVLKYLLTFKVFTEEQKNAAMTEAFRRKSLDCIKILLDHGILVKNEYLFISVQSYGKKDRLKDIFSFVQSVGYNLTARNDKDESLEDIACDLHQIETLRILFALGVPISRSDRGNSAIHRMISRSSCRSEFVLQVVELYLENGWDINSENDDGDTVLLLFHNKLSYDIVEFLISKGASIFHENNKGESFATRAQDVLGSASYEKFAEQLLRFKKKSATSIIHVPEQ